MFREKSSRRPPDEKSSRIEFRFFFFVSLLFLSLTLTDTANGQALEEDPESINELELSETPPQPEPPYPGAENGDFAADPSMKTSAQKEISAPQAQLPRPKKIDEDGVYFYDTAPETPTQTARPGIPKADRFADDGSFQYKDTKETPVFSGRPGLERPIQMLASGEFRYHVEATKASKSASFRFGVTTPPTLKNKDNGLSFADIYGSSPLPVLFIDYEFYRLFNSAGRLGIKFGSGLVAANGPGHFRSLSRATELPDERYTFVLLPNTLTASYKFQFSDKQVLVPFIEGGAGYYTFAEIRDDGAKTRMGGALVALGGGGVNFLLDWIDPQAIRQLDAEYGISHLWITGEVRATVGLNSDLNFSNNSVNAGFLMEF